MKDSVFAFTGCGTNATKWYGPRESIHNSVACNRDMFECNIDSYYCLQRTHFKKRLKSEKASGKETRRMGMKKDLYCIIFCFFFTLGSTKKDIVEYSRMSIWKEAKEQLTAY